MIEGMFNTGAMPALERLVQFTGQRHRLITHNIANRSTPNFRPRDLDVGQFQQTLVKAIDERRETDGVFRSGLELRDTSELRFTKDGLEMRSDPLDENILFHDRNNRNLERQMQDLAENAMTHNAALQMMRNQFDLMETAISERV